MNGDEMWPASEYQFRRFGGGMEFWIESVGPQGYLSRMRRFWLYLALAAMLCCTGAAKAATGRVIKVLPEFLDLKGRNSLTPSLYERDVYQALLRQHPERRSSLRFYIQWKTTGPVWQPLTVRVEMRGIAEGNLPKQLSLEQAVENSGGHFSHWATVTLSEQDYKKIGSVTAWRVTFWEGKTLLGTEQSFLW